MATLVTFRIAGWPAAAALAELGRRVVRIARTIDRLDALRISVGFFNTDDEIDRFAETVELLAAHTPETIPPRRTLTILGTTDDDRPSRRPAGPGRQRSWAEIRWRQFRNAPRPIVRAVASSLVVAIVLAVAYVAYDVAMSRGAALPGGDLRVLAVAVYVVARARHGSVVTYLGRAPADGLRDRSAAERLERGPRILRGGPDRVARAGRRGPGAQAADRLRPPRRVPPMHDSTRGVIGTAHSPYYALRIHSDGILRRLASRRSGIRPLISRIPALAIDEQHVALPKLYGAPAYARPPRPSR